MDLGGINFVLPYVVFHDYENYVQVELLLLLHRLSDINGLHCTVVQI